MGLERARTWLGSIAAVAILWSFTGLPGIGLMRDAWPHLATQDIKTEAIVVGTRARGLVTRAVAGKGASSPLRHYEGQVALQLPGGQVVSVIVTAPDIVRGEEQLRGELARYRDGANVVVYCQEENCRFEPHASLPHVAQLLFGIFLFALVPLLLGYGVWLGKRG